MFHNRKIQFILVTLLAHTGFIVAPELFLQIYQSVIFPIFRIVYDHTLGFSPIPVVYFAVMGLIVFLIIKGRDIFKYRHALLYSFYYKDAIKKITLYVLLFTSLFYWVWGFHYYQKSLFPSDEQKVVMIDENYLANEINVVLTGLNQLRKTIRKEEILALKVSGFSNIENMLRGYQKGILSQLGVNVIGKVRVRVIEPEGVLLHWSTAGIYIPFVFEGHIDGGLHPLQYIFTGAHEMAHGYSVTNEGDCNVMALLTCLEADQNMIRYAGLLTYFRYLMYDPRGENMDKQKFIDKLSDDVKNDLDEIREQSKKFPDYFPAIRDYIYDFYLKWMGVEDGLASYNSMIDKVAVLKNKTPEFKNFLQVK